MNLACATQPGIADTNPMHFTGKQRDSETGLDYFGARFNASNLGRFMTPDWSARIEPVPYARLFDPQTLNLYVYARNNPLSLIDIDGHTADLCGSVQAGDCRQSAPDAHGNVTVAMSQTSTSAPTTDSNGVTTTTTTTTNNTYTFSQNGTLTAATHETQTVTETTDSSGHSNITTSGSGGPQNLSISAGIQQAAQQFGATNLTSFQNSMLRANTKGFWGQTKADAQHHPWKYVAAGLGVASGGLGLAAAGTAAVGAAGAEAASVLSTASTATRVAGMGVGMLDNSWLNVTPY
jgi:RHS repeat-associated protein